MATAPDNPRLLWVLGPIRWSSPPEQGGGRDKAFEIYNKGLEAARNQKRGVVDPLQPSWGEPELLMSLAESIHGAQEKGCWRRDSRCNKSMPGQAIQCEWSANKGRPNRKHS